MIHRRASVPLKTCIKKMSLGNECNRPFARHGHVTLSIIKNGRGTEQMPEMKRACQKYESGRVRAS